MRNLLKRFLRNNDGNIAIMSAAMIGPMIFAAAIGMDVAETHRARINFQSAVDAAALATAKVIARKGDHDDAKEYGTNIFYANMRNLTSSKTKATITFNTGNGDCSDQGIVANGTLEHPTHFGATDMFFDNGVLKKNGSGKVSLTASSTVNCGSDSIEVALVLDNSGSMDWDDNLGIRKLNTMKSAAAGLVNTLHDSMANSSKPDPISFSLVPFSSFVNVGPGNKNASWMDTQGRSSIHHEHLNWEKGDVGTPSNGGFVDGSNNALTRFSLYDGMGISWKGCVEQRPFPLHTQDDTPGPADPDTYYVPSFAPDGPDDYSGNKEQISNGNGGGSVYCTSWDKNWYRYRKGRRWKWTYKWECSRWSDGSRGAYHNVAGYAYRPSVNYDSNGNYLGGGAWSNGNNISEEDYFNDYLEDAHNLPNDMEKYNIVHTGTGPKQYSRQKWTFKYFAHSPSLNESSLKNPWGNTIGPNYGCSAIPLTPLTAKREVALDGIDDMIASGLTNIPMGVAWGWRTLSPGSPFTEGRAKNEDGNRKIMIVMTDGDNTNRVTDKGSTRNPMKYSAHGHNGGEYGSDTNTSNGDADLPERLFVGYQGQVSPSNNSATYTAAMDEHMVTTCNNAKADGIEVYTIAFDVDNGSPVQATLKLCASKNAAAQPLYYNASDATALQAAFDDIAERIAELSITK